MAVFFLLAIFCLDCKIKHYCLLAYHKGLLNCMSVPVLASTMNNARYYDNMLATERKKCARMHLSCLSRTGCQLRQNSGIWLAYQSR